MYIYEKTSVIFMNNYLNKFMYIHRNSFHSSGTKFYFIREDTCIYPLFDSNILVKYMN